MIIAKIVQSGQVITLEDALKTFRYSANLQMQFVKDPKYKDYILIGWYRHLRKEEYLLDIDKDGIFTLGKDIFKQRGTVEFSFSLNNPANGEIIHLGVIEYTVEQSFGSGDAILPENEDIWIQVVSRVVEDQVSDIWDKDYKPQLEQNINIIKTKTEEINAAAMEVKQNALESSINAKSALDSANLAQSSANTALEAKEKALEYSTNAEQFKNDAFSYANQANIAKTEAQQSATDASNSASNALTNANKTKEHLDNVIEKVNAFNADYTEKVNNFNSNVENANNTLDAKIEKANTDIDKKVLDANTNLDTKITDANTSIDAKVTEATEQASKAKQEADRAILATDGKLNKNQGVENAGKAMVVDADGNVVPGSALPDNVYTQEEVDYLLADKMDKPYTNIMINENTTLSDCLDGNFKIDSIEGNTYQKIETDIVPTPEREVPIVSKKIAVNGEVVELRSLKESVNLFDFGLLSKTELIPKTEAYRKIDIPLRLKPNTQYVFSYDDWEVPASSWVVLNIINAEGAILSGVFNINNGTSTEVRVINKNKHSFTTDATGQTYFSYYASGGDNPYINLWFTKLLTNIMLVEGTTVPSTYVAPTVRDYKIVDHVNKKSWIERNIAVAKNNNNKNFNDYTETNHRVIFGFDNRKPLTKVGAPNVICNIATPSPLALDLKDILWETGNTYLYWYPNIYNLGLDGTETKTDANTKLNEFLTKTPMFIQYELAESFIEEIEYLESDISEFGVSSQDSTSPSLTIKSEIEKVEILNIKACGKNLFNETLAKDINNYEERGVSDYCGITLTLLPNTKYTISRKDNLGIGLDKYVYVKGTTDGWLVHNSLQNLNNKARTVTTKEDGTIIFRIAMAYQEQLDAAWEVLGYIQLELGDTATEYEPYQETGFSYELAKPLKKVGDIADVIDLNKLERKNNIYKEDITTLTISSIDNAGGYNHINTTNRFYNLNVSSNAKSSSNYKTVISSILPYVQNVWIYDKIGITINARNQVHVCLPNLILGISENDSSEDRKIKLNNYIKSLKGTGNEYIYYALETTTTEPLEPELVKKLKQLKTYGPVTHIFIYGEVKPTVNAKYPKDILLAQQKLETKLLNLQTEVIKNV